MKKEELIRRFNNFLHSKKKFNQAETPPWERVSVLDIKEYKAGIFTVLVNRELQDLHKMADYETFEYREVFRFHFDQEKDTITYNLLYRVLFLHVYLFDGFPGLFNTRRFEARTIFYDSEKKLNKIISNLKFLSKSGKTVSIKKGQIQEFRDFGYRCR
jgi:hypothetical protein